MRSRTILFAAAAVSLAGGAALAQPGPGAGAGPGMGQGPMAGHMQGQGGMGPGHMQGQMPGRGGMGPGHMAPATDEFMTSMRKMNQDMMAATGATVDETFARKMIAHHQGAIDMAQIELKRGSDAKAKRMAQKTIDENRRGIRELENFLKSRGR